MNNHNPIKIMTNKHIVSSLALSGLLLAITGCNNSFVNTKATQKITNTPSLPDKTKEQADSKADSKDVPNTADDSASTPEGINTVINANNQFAVAMYQTPVLIASPEKSEVHTSVLYAIQIIVCMVF